MPDPLRIPYTTARGAVGPLYRALVGVAERVAVVGALRRQEPIPGDVEVLVRLRASADLFGASRPEADGVRQILRDWGDLVRDTGTVLQAAPREPGRPRVTVAVVGPDASWGLSVLRATGPASFVARVHQALASRGLRVAADGTRLLDAAGAPAAADDEVDVFALAGLPPVPPERRAAGVDEADPPRPRDGAPAERVAKHRGVHQGRGMTIEADDAA